MAEFTEVMWQLNRMCSHYQNCEDSGCPLSNDCGNIGNYSSNAKQAMRIEKTVMQWAAENPEPIYPTWGEYLASIGVMKPAEPNKAYEVWFTQLYSTNIPADIAKKLGIEPKEV